MAITPPMTGKTVLITGATSGVGKATAMGLANMGARVVMVGRDRGRGEAAMADIKEDGGNASVDLMLDDVSSQKEIRRLADEFGEAYPRLDVPGTASSRPTPRSCPGRSTSSARKGAIGCIK